MRHLASISLKTFLSNIRDGMDSEQCIKLVKNNINTELPKRFNAVGDKCYKGSDTCLVTQSVTPVYDSPMTHRSKDCSYSALVCLVIYGTHRNPSIDVYLFLFFYKGYKIRARALIAL